MAERRMFAKTIVLSDDFLDMPMSARCLYFTLGMFADDDGFVNSPKGIMRQCGASEDDIKLLLTKKYLLVFDSGVIVIRHWRINNYLRNDRYSETKCLTEKSELKTDESGAYQFENSGIPNSGIPNNGIPSIGKDRKELVKDKDIYTVESADADTTECGENEREKKSVFKNKTEMTVVADIIAYLNDKANTAYRPGTKDTVRHIRARLAEGFTVDNFKTVIDKMTGQWLGTEMAPFLRPQTLFSAKFESYLNGQYGGRKLSGRRQYNADGTYYQNGQKYGRAGTAIRENAKSNPNMDLLGGEEE